MNNADQASNSQKWNYIYYSNMHNKFSYHCLKIQIHCNQTYGIYIYLTNLLFAIGRGYTMCSWTTFITIRLVTYPLGTEHHGANKTMVNQLSRPHHQIIITWSGPRGGECHSLFLHDITCALLWMKINFIYIGLLETILWY